MSYNYRFIIAENRAASGIFYSVIDYEKYEMKTGLNEQQFEEFLKTAKTKDVEVMRQMAYDFLSSQKINNAYCRSVVDACLELAKNPSLTNDEFWSGVAALDTKDLTKLERSNLRFVAGNMEILIFKGYVAIRGKYCL